MYGKSGFFPIEFEINTLRTTTEENLDLMEAYKNHLNQLNELDEKRTNVVHHTSLIQQQCSKWHDRFIKKKIFCEGDLDLLYDSQFKRDFKGKLCTRWLGPYKIDKVFDNGTIYLPTINENQIPLFANGHRLWICHKLISKDGFISQVSFDPGSQLV